MRIVDDFALLQILAHQICIQALKMALIGATIILLAEASSMAATITVHAPDGDSSECLLMSLGRIENGHFETFKQKTDQIEASHPKKLVIVTLMSYGGVIHPAIQIGELVRKRRMLTFVPGDHTCASACAIIWVSGWLRTVGDTPQIGFHAAYDKDTQRETGAANALVGAYLRDLEFSYEAIHFMTRKGPTDLEWLTPDSAKEVGVAWFPLQPPRAIPLPPQQPGLQPPLQVIAAWSKLMPRPVTASPERGNYTVVFKRPSQNRPEEPLPVPAVITPSPPPVTTGSQIETCWENVEFHCSVTITPSPERGNYRSGWFIQVGVFPAEQEAKKRLSSAQTKAAKLLTKAEAFTEDGRKGRHYLVSGGLICRSRQGLG